MSLTAKASTTPRSSHPSASPSTSRIDSPCAISIRRGFWSNAEARYVFVHEEIDGSLELVDVVSLQYWIDSNTPLQVDLADAATVNFASLVPHFVGPGPHNFYLRYISADGRYSNTEKLPFFVWSAPGPARRPA